MVGSRGIEPLAGPTSTFYSTGFTVQQEEGNPIRLKRQGSNLHGVVGLTLLGSYPSVYHFATLQKLVGSLSCLSPISLVVARSGIIGAVRVAPIYCPDQPLMVVVPLGQVGEV